MTILNFFKSLGFLKSGSDLMSLDDPLLADIGVSVSSVRRAPMRSPLEIGTDRV
ncbi:MAG: hypothetical protein HQ501_09005 [Rhodospirillales bacterium]|nr:hypothetical protein [Rhodospirillales bacterium]